MYEEKQIVWDGKKPGISVNLDSGRIAIHRTTLEVLGYPEFYRFLLNLEQKQWAIQACGIDDTGAHSLPDIKDRETCDVNSKDLVRLLYRSCRWNRKMSYRIQGIGYPEQKTVSFSLMNALELNEMKNND
jgi:hypothetical protein